MTDHTGPISAAGILRSVSALAFSTIFGATALVLAAQPQDYSAPVRIDSGRFTFVCYPADSVLARSLVGMSIKSDTFPGLPRPRERVLIAIAPNEQRFREWIGPSAPEWGAAVAFPSLNRIVLQGSGSGSDAGNPRVVLRHELAHLALDEFLGDLPPRWFDEGYASYAAGEWQREEALAANLFLVLRGVPSLDSLDAGFHSTSNTAQATYALSHVAVADLAALDRERGLSLFLGYWRDSRSLEQAVRSAYGLTLNGFETRWKRSVMRRYGLIAIVTDVGIIAAAIVFLLLPLYIRRRRRMRDRLEKLRAAESAAERRAVSETLTQLLGESQPGPPGARRLDEAGQ